MSSLRYGRKERIRGGSGTATTTTGELLQVLGEQKGDKMGIYSGHLSDKQGKLKGRYPTSRNTNLMKLSSLLSREI